MSGSTPRWGLPPHGALARFLRGPVRRMLTPLLQAWLRRHSLRVQHWRLGRLRLRIDPGVFPSGPTLCTASFVRWLLSPQGPGPWRGRRVLDLGCGCGAIGLAIAQAGAQVLASDLSEKAARNAAANAQAHQLPVQVVVADLLAGLNMEALDCVLINPPFFARDPQSIAERAWFCGANLEYFHALFGQLAELDLQRTLVLMALSEDCDDTRIGQVARAAGLELERVGAVRHCLEWTAMLRVRASS